MRILQRIDNRFMRGDLQYFKSLKFENDSKFLDTDQYLIRYRLYGKGKYTVVITPNPMNMIEHYDQLVQVLGESFQVLVFELPGFGFSLPKQSNYDYSLKSTTIATIAVLEALQLSNCILALPSMSGYISLKIGEIRPDLVHGIVNIQMLNWEQQQQWAHNIHKKVPLKTPLLGQLYFRMNKQRTVEKWYYYAVPNESIQQSYIDIALENFAKGAHYSLASTFQAFFNNEKPPLRPLNVPALFIWGKKDKTHGKYSKWSAIQYLNDYEPHDFEGAGHYPELEQPERFTRLMQERFLKADLVTTKDYSSHQ